MHLSFHLKLIFFNLIIFISRAKTSRQTGGSSQGKDDTSYSKHKRKVTASREETQGCHVCHYVEDEAEAGS